MPRTRPLLAIQKLNGKRYIRYGKKKWIVADTQTRSDKILKRLDKLIKLLLKQKTNAKLNGLNRVGKQRLLQEQPSIKAGVVSSGELERNILRSMPSLLIPNQKPPNPPTLNKPVAVEAPTEPHADENKARIEKIEKALIEVGQEGVKLKQKVAEQENANKILELSSTNNKLYTTYGELLASMGVKPLTTGISKNKSLIEEITKNHPEVAGIVFNPDLKSQKRKQMLKQLSETNPKYRVAGEGGEGGGEGGESELDWPEIWDGDQSFIAPLQEGTGDTEGLSNEDILKVFKKKPVEGFLGVFSLDTIPKEPPENFSFITNTEKFPTPGHWVSVKGDKNTLEYFDPFGKRPSDAMQKALKHMIHDRGLVQFKINRIKKQRIDSKRCGWHAIKFLHDRKTKSFSETTGFNAKKLQAINRSEDAVKKLEKKYKDFLKI